jgi:hypothetical protein
MYPGTGSTAIRISHLPNELARRLRLKRHRVGERLEHGGVDLLPGPFGGEQASDGIAAPGYRHRLTGFCPLDQRAEVALASATFTSLMSRLPKRSRWEITRHGALQNHTVRLPARVAPDPFGPPPSRRPSGTRNKGADVPSAAGWKPICARLSSGRRRFLIARASRPLLNIPEKRASSEKMRARRPRYE